VKRLTCIATLLTLSACNTLQAQKPPLLPEKDVAAIANELSGETAKRNLEGIARFHRQRGSKGFHEAAELVAERLRAYGLSDVAILQFPADGKIFYGTQRSRPAWDADFAELWEIAGAKSGSASADQSGQMSMTRQPGARVIAVSYDQRIASYEAEPVVLAEDSESANVTAELVDVGSGTKDADYTGKEVKGKLILSSAQPGAIQDLAVGKFGAVGIISYAQNQKTAWSGENQDAIRWGHLETFSADKTFAFMVSLKTARTFQSRLASGEKVTLHAVVKAGQHPANYEVVTATIPGSDPKLKDEEIAFSCHLDHQRPGANDNASGCATILEVARTLQKLTARQASGGCVESKVESASKNARDSKSLNDCNFLLGVGKLRVPARTIRFIFPPEIEGTMTLLNGKREFAKRIKAVVHMDMVGGGPETKAVFHVTRGPMSLPSFVHDVAWAFADWLNGQSYQFAATGEAAYPMVAPEGGKEPLRAEYSAYTMGSDHDVYQDSSFAIPAIYLNDWPDRFIHTNFDSAANIDPTKLKRAAFIGAASGYYLAALTVEKAKLFQDEVGAGWFAASFYRVWRYAGLSPNEAENVRMHRLSSNMAIGYSLQKFVHDPNANDPWVALGQKLAVEGPVKGQGALRFARKLEPKGPPTVFGYDYFAEHAKSAGIPTLKLLDYEGLWGSGEEYAYEVANFIDGKRNAQEIRDAVSAEYGPVPLDFVVEYLRALEKIGLVEQLK
jgi:aminopeptidase YwaD